MIPAYRPTERQELILRAALLSGEAARAAWLAIRDAIASERLDGGSESLLPLVYRNIASLGDRHGGIEALKGRYLSTWSDNLRAFHAVQPLLEAFERHGVDPIVLKGLALIARFYRDPGVRPMADVDVLVPPVDVARARELAAAHGWHPRYPLTPAFVRVKHAGPFDHRLGVACDIHWRMFEEAAVGEADRDVRAAAEYATFHGTRLRVPSPTDQLLHVCGHAARWNEVPAIRWVTDATVILREGPIDWPRLLRHTAERRFVLRMRDMLRYLRQALGAAIPPWVEARLAELPVSTLERLEHRVRSREHPMLGELPAYVFNCFRGERHPLIALPGYLRDAWELESLATVPRHALRLAIRRVRAMAVHGSRFRWPRGADGRR